MPNWLKVIFGLLLFIALLALASILYQNWEQSKAADSTPVEILQEESVSIVVETFQVLATGQLDPFPGIDVLVSAGSEFVKVGETAMKTIDGIPAPVWEGDVSIGSWVTIGLPENCVIWKVGADLWEGAYEVSATYAGSELPLKFQIVCGENIPSPTPGLTNPPSGPTDTPPPPPTNTPPPPDTETPPPQPTDTPPPPPTEVDCNCETPETAVPTPEPPDEPTATPIW